MYIPFNGLFMTGAGASSRAFGQRALRCQGRALVLRRYRSPNTEAVWARAQCCGREVKRPQTTAIGPLLKVPKGTNTAVSCTCLSMVRLWPVPGLRPGRLALTKASNQSPRAVLVAEHVGDLSPSPALRSVRKKSHTFQVIL